MNPNLATMLERRNAARGSRSFLRQAFCLAALFVCLAGPGAVHGQAALGETWEWRNPLPQGSGLRALVESDGNLIAVGRAGIVLTSTDGMSWTPRVSGTRNYLQGVASSEATVVAVGGGDIVTSTDGGLTWALRSSSAVSWNTVIHGGGLWVAAGYSETTQPYTGRVMISPDGLTWTAVTVPNNSGTYFTCAVWTGLRFVLGGSANTFLGSVALATSEDGITWTQRAAGLQIRGLAWTGSRIAGVGSQILLSPDGITWNEALTPGPGSGVVWTGTQLLGWTATANHVHTSPTGETWTQRVSPKPNVNSSLLGAAGTGTTLILGGHSGFIIHSPDSGVTWNTVSSGVEGHIYAIARFAGRWVAVGDGGSLTSSADGVIWTPASSGTLSWLRGLAWHNGLWVAVGYSILTSTDGVAWTNRYREWNQPYSVIHTGSQWVAAARYGILTSPDGITWQAKSVGGSGPSYHSAVAWNGSRMIVVTNYDPDDDPFYSLVYLSDDGGDTWTLFQNFTALFDVNQLNGIAWTGSQFVIVANAGRVFTSPTGAAGTWTSQTSGTDQSLRGVIAEGGGLVAVGGYSSGPVILTSPDAVTWTPRTAPTSQVLLGISKAGSLYVATGSGGDVLTSPDAVTWTAHTTPTTNSLYAAAWDGEQLLVAGWAGAILASTGPPLKWKSLALLPGSDFGLRLTWLSTPERIYDIESTTTLAPPWLPIPGSPRTATGPEEFIDFTESGPSAGSPRFFRVRERP